jgi:hypothetical protein
MKVLGHQDIAHHLEFQFAAQRIKGGDKWPCSDLYAGVYG